MENKMNELPWFKFYYESLNDPKFDVIANDNGMQSWEILGIWTALLCIASNSPIRGTLAISDSRGLAIEDLKSIIKWNDNYWDNTEFQDTYHFEKIIQSFIELDMLILDEFNCYKIKNFDTRQETKEEKEKRLHRERQKRYEESHKSVNPDVINDADLTQPSSSSSSSSSISDSLITTSLTITPNIFTIYENTVGAITPLIQDKLIAAEKDYPELWINRAFEIAVEQDKRNWAYVHAILDRWHREGYDGDKRNGSHGKLSKEAERTTDAGRKAYAERAK